MRKVKTSLKGRKCRFHGCSHTLSIYNHEEYCHVHLGQVTQDKKSRPHKKK